MKSTKHSYSKEIETFSLNALHQRSGVGISSDQTVIRQSKGNEIFRIIHNAGKTFVSTRQEHIPIIQEYLYTNDIAEKLRSPAFHREILELLGYDSQQFLLEPSEEFLQDIKYNCVHMLDYVCTKNSFVPQSSNQVEPIYRGDERFIVDDNFVSTMYCMTDQNRIVGCSYYKPNQGVFANTCAMQVFVRPEYRGKGYGKATASAATQAVVQENRLALWACQVENIPSQKIAESLGYIFLGGELRIVK